jgi:hypothetical protein
MILEDVVPSNKQIRSFESEGLWTVGMVVAGRPLKLSPVF